MIIGFTATGYQKKEQNNMFDDDSYLADVSKAFERLSKAETPDEIKDVLEDWPEKENYFVKNEEVEDINNEIENIQEQIH